MGGVSSRNKVKLYLIGGLGADERVFRYLNLTCGYQVLDWMKPTPGETLESYVSRLIIQIDVDQPFGLVGVSFGGLIAIELAKQIKTEKVILISSAATQFQLPENYLRIGKTGILNLLPNAFIKPTRFLLRYLFGAENISLLKDIIKNTDPAFIRWALQTMIHWKNVEDHHIIRIHGTNDKLIPLVGSAIEIEGGAHFMIVDRAAEISDLLNHLSGTKITH